jgi:hypothetical protein
MQLVHLDFVCSKGNKSASAFAISAVEHYENTHRKTSAPPFQLSAKGGVNLIPVLPPSVSRAEKAGI